MRFKLQSIIGFFVEEMAKQRKSLFLWSPVCVGLGIIAYFQIFDGIGWSKIATIAFLTCLIGSKFFHLYSKKGQIGFLLGVICSVAFGLMITGYGVAKYRVDALQTLVLLEDIKPQEVRGYIEKLVYLDGGKAKRVILSNVRLDNFDRPLRLRLKSYHFKGDEWRNGDFVSVKAKLMAPSGPAYPGGFDFSEKAFFEGISAVGYTMADAELVEKSYGNNGYVQKIRDVMGKKIYAIMDDRYGGVAQALLTGERSGLSSEDTENLRIAGLAHLLAISGLHIGLVAGCVFFFVRLFLVIIPGLALHYPIKKWAACCAILIAFIYMVLAGATVPTLRAFIMTSLVLLAIILDRSALNMRLVALAAIIVMITSPESIMGPSFVLSFSAVAGLIVFYQNLGQKWFTNANAYRPLWRPFYYVVGIIVTSMVATFATAPFTVMFFNRFAIYSIISNVVAMPLMAFVVMPFGLIATLVSPFGLDAYAWQIMEWGISQILIIADAVTHYPYADLYWPSFDTHETILICFGFLWLLLWQGYFRWIGMIMVVYAFLLPLPQSKTSIFIDEKMKAIMVVDKSVDNPFLIGKANKYTKVNWLGSQGINPHVDINNYYYGDDIDNSMGYCDDTMCRLDVEDVDITILMNPIAIPIACQNTDIVIATMPVAMTSYCTDVRVIDRFDIWRFGATKIEISDGYYKVQTVK